MQNFSSINRASIVEKAVNIQFDLIIIGGGITGAGVALDASYRGLKVLLIDMQDFAAGTSSRSTKLIHGGLRYLKQLEFKLVSEVGKERKIVHQNAPHLTKPEPMLLPIVSNGSLGKLSARIGMWMYEWLAGVKKEEWHRVLSKDETIAAEPLLKKDNLLGGILFYEYRTDDARLCIEVMKEAVNKGTIALSYMRCSGFNYKNNKISGIEAIDELTGNSHVFSSTYIVNAAGPWVDNIDALDNKENKPKLHITKGIHLVVDEKKLNVKQSVYFDTPDKRMLFVIPRDGKTYIGTTDTFYKGNLSNPEISTEDKNYILNCVNAFFPNKHLSHSDIESGWAGLRPLVNKAGKGPSEISRKDEMFVSQSGLITIAGGKLTGYRKMATRVVDKIAEFFWKHQQIKLPDCTTANIAVSGGNLNGAKNFDTFEKIQQKKGIEIGLNTAQIKSLVNRFGSNTDEIFRLYTDLKKQENSTLPPFIEAQLIYCMHHEMCISPCDFFVRRTASLYFDIDTVKKYKAAVIAYMAQMQNLSDKNIQSFRHELEEALAHFL